MIVNGQEIHIAKGVTLHEFLKSQDYNTERLAVERNQQILKKEEYGSIYLDDEDRLEIVSFVGGG